MVKTLTRSDIAEAISEEFCVTKFDALDFLEAILDEISNALMDEETVKITGFGSFRILHKKERMGRNPRTQEPAVISARKTISFKASPILKRKMNGEV